MHPHRGLAGYATLAASAHLCLATLACRPDPAPTDAPHTTASAQRFARLTRSPDDQAELARWVVAIAITRARGHVALIDDRDQVVWGTRPPGEPIAIDDDVRAAMAREPLASLHWMVGSWSGTADGATTTERWCPDALGRLVGDNRTIMQSREVAFELLAILEVDGVITYAARPGGRTPATPFAREATTAPSAAIFANPAHDFPQRLSYVRTDDRLDVRADGSGQQLVFAWTGPWPSAGDVTATAAGLAQQCDEVLRAAGRDVADGPPANPP